MNAYLGTMRRYASFSGRTSRQEFWWAHAVLLPVMIIAGWVLSVPVRERSIWPTLPFALIFLSHLLPWAALVVRRIHDMDRTGWWAVLSLVPLLVLPPIVLIAVLPWGVLRGTPGPNRYGPGRLDTMSSASTSGTISAHAAAPMGETAVSDPVDLIADLERLSLLRADGTLTTAEFEVMKARALGMGRTAR